MEAEMEVEKMAEKLVCSLADEPFLAAERQYVDKSLVHKTSQQQVLISNITNVSKNCGFNVSDVELFRCKVIPNLKCSFCFDHPLDHMPMMMMLECARQMALATTHVYKNIDVANYVAIIENMKFNNMFFVEIDHPLYLYCLDKLVTNKTNVQSRNVKFYYVQNKSITTSAVSDIKVMHKSIYKRLRKRSRFMTLSDTDSSSPIKLNIDLLEQQ